MTYQFKEGSSIYISTGVATAHCTIGVSGVLGTILCVSEKAIQIQSYTENDKAVKFWLPKKALKFKKYCNVTHTYNFDLAHWFKLSGWTSKAIEITQRHSVISA